MKRHPSLAHLSREHHGALLLARLIQKGAPVFRGMPADTEGKSMYALKFYKEELVKHFEEEEKALKLVSGIDPALDSLVSGIFNEHHELHNLFKSLNNQSDLPAYLDVLGKTLEIHIRKEERQLFPLIERAASEELMAAIDKSLSPN